MFISKMQDMYSSNLSGIHNITSFSKCLPWGVTGELAATNWSSSLAGGAPRPRRPLGVWETTCSAREEVTQPSGKWEGRPEPGPRAQLAPPAPRSTSADPSPVTAFPQQDESGLSAVLEASWGLKAPAAHRGPRVCSLEIQLQSPPGGSRRLHNQECPSSPPCPGQGPLGSSVAPMKAEGRDLQGGGRLQAGRICPRGNLGEEAPGLCTQRWAWRPLWGKDK